MATIKAHTLSGFMELLPAPQTQMERLMEVLRSSYGVYGFTPLDTPIIEASDVLLAKGGGETEKQIYRFSKGDSDLSLRFDLTVPLAKYVALHYADLAFPFRRFQIGKVYRGERAQRGRFREFYQADIDVIGDGEADEGQVWEAFHFAYAHKLDNIIYFIDNNGYQLDGPTADILDHGNIAKKAESFGLYTQEIDGHDVKAIYDAIQNAYAKKGVPSCIVLDTCKGKGATFAEPKHDHSSQPNEEQWAEALAAAEKALEDAKNA